MKKFLKFLEENSKWVVSVLVGVGIFFIVKLWWVGMFVSSGGGGFISIGIGGDFRYYRMSAGYIALALLIFSIFLIFLIKNTQNKNRKIQIAFLIFILGIIGKQIFFLISPDYKFYLTPVTSQYKDKEGNVTDINKYLELVGKYCKNIKYSYIGNCNTKYASDFKTVDDYIKVLEFANKNNDKKMYREALKKFGDIELEGYVENYSKLKNEYIELINKYNDDTFYMFLIINSYINLEYYDLLIKNIGNEYIKDLLIYYSIGVKQNIINYENDKNFDYEKSMEVIIDTIKKRSLNIDSINAKILNIK